MNEQTEKLRERVAGELASFENVKWESLPDKATTFFTGANKAQFLRHADQILKACKEAGLKFVETDDKTDYLEYWDFGMKIREIDE